MKKSIQLQVKQILKNWIIDESIEWDDCKEQLELIISIELTDDLMNQCNSEEIKLHELNERIEEVIEIWEEEIMSEDENFYFAHYYNDAPEPDYLLN